MNGRSPVVVAMVLLLCSAGIGMTVGVGAQSTAQSQPDGNQSTQGIQGIQGIQEEVSVLGSPDLDVHLPAPIVQPGQTNDVTLQITNDGSLTRGPASAREIVTTARNVRVEADAEDTPLTVRTGKTAIGSISENEPREVPIAVDVPEEIDAGTYELDVDVSYSHTRQQSRSGVTQDRSRTYSTTVEVEVDDDARFQITDATTDAQIGDRGTLEATVENTGSDRATDATLALESQSGGFLFGESASDSARISDLDPGEKTTVRYDVAIPDDTTQRQYTLDGTVQFKTPDGLQRADESPSVGVIPEAKQRFGLSDVDSELYVGEDGDVHGVLTNHGPNTAENVVLRYTDESSNVIPIEESVSVGSLDSGESESFRLPIEIRSEAEPVSRALDVAVQYRNADLEQRLYEDVELGVDVAPKRDQFLVDVLDREIEAGADKLVDVEVTNNLDQTVTDVEARLFANDPLDSDDDEGFIEKLDPGETVTLTFELEADGSATAKTYPVSFDFRYDDERGTSTLSDTTRVSIQVTEASDGFPWLVVGLIVLTAIGAGAGAYAYRRG